MILQPTFKTLKVVSTYLLMALGTLTVANNAQAVISQSPLVAGSSSAPGSLALTPSVEFPTILTYANLNAYVQATTYTGYFDSNKCYTYKLVSPETATDKSRFVPTSTDDTHACAGDNVWSGNHLNWATTQTIDPFRSALTGGFRVVDEPTLTILQKARNTGQSTIENRQITKTFTNSALSPSKPLYVRFSTTSATDLLGGAKIRFTVGAPFRLCSNTSCSNYTTADVFAGCKDWRTFGTECKALTADGTKPVVAYDGTNLKSIESTYEAFVRVEVCKKGLLESNCKPYGTNYKPEGLLQQYSTQLRYSVFGYLNDGTATRDGGVMRASQKFIGPLLANQTKNPRAEWLETTGQFIQNPENITSSMGVTISDSGAINYLNKFGELTTNNHKSFDPVSELYYSAIRYFKGLQSVPSYSSQGSANPALRTQWADGFPVITDWKAPGMDPITYSCQKNFILGIGDTNTHKDKNLPSAEATSTDTEPTKPAEVIADKSVDVVAATRRVQTIESNDTPGINLRVLDANFRNNQNSAYMVGLAYDSHTRDIRDDVADKQTISTYWVDVREGGVLQPRATNQYWLAAKYGGFTIPNDFGDPYTRTATLPQDSWTNNAPAIGSIPKVVDTLSTGDQRPRNFFVASDATLMVDSLKKAFAAIVKASGGTATSLSANSTQLDTGSAVFQSSFSNTRWSGDLQMKKITKGVVQDKTWSAAAKLDALSGVTTRNILTTNTPVASQDGTYLTSTSGVDFAWASMDLETRKALTATADSNVFVGDTTGQLRVNYLRGDRSQEKTSPEDTAHAFRQRDSRMGDVINSDPVYIAKQDYGYNLLRNTKWGSAGTKYLEYRASSSYQSRIPVVAVGANDGMLHAFNATDTTALGGGNELFAYVPRSVVPRLYELTDPAYQHRFYVDGAPAASDAYINGGWKSLLVGTTGAGGNSVFALDVTSPTSVSSANVLWEFSAPDMGATMFKPTIVALETGKFAVLASSGYFNTAVTSGQVWLLDAADGKVIKKFTLPTTGNLGEPLAVDLNNDRMTDRIYVGDTQGKLWRIDITGAESQWGVPSSLKSGSVAQPLFTARDSDGAVQPITAPLSAALNTDGNPIILFGTGTFYQTTDNDLTQTQHYDSFYGLIDKGVVINSNRSTLLEQQIKNELTEDKKLMGRVLTQNLITSTRNGWYLDLVWKTAQNGPGKKTGERIVSRAAIRSGVVVFASLTPVDNACSGGYSSWIMAMDLFTGGRLNYNFFDMDGNGSLGDSDSYTDSSNKQTPYSGRSNPNEGAVKTPTFFNGDGADAASGGTNTDDLICIAGSSSDAAKCSPAPKGTRLSDRVSWRELR